MSNLRVVLFASTEKIETGDHLSVETGKVERRSFVPVKWAEAHSIATKRSNSMPFEYLNADCVGRTLKLALLCLAIAGTGMAQSIELPGQQKSGQVLIQAAPADTGQTDLAYFLGQQDAVKADAARLLAEMDDLQKKCTADPNAGLREQIREREAFASMLQNVRSEAHRLATDPMLLPTYDWQMRDAQESIKNLNADLNARLRAPNTDRSALKNQINRLQKEIELNNKLAKTLAEKIKSLADDRRREGVMSELDALTKPTSIGSLAGAAASVINRDKEKEQ